MLGLRCSVMFCALYVCVFTAYLAGPEMMFIKFGWQCDDSIPILVSLVAAFSFCCHALESCCASDSAFVSQLNVW
jgi:hypothetical protein